MNLAGRVAVLALILARLAVTVFDWNAWPLCSYDMFSRTWPTELAVLRVHLSDDAGGEQIVWPGNVVPLEFFRANAILAESAAWAEPRRSTFFDTLLDRLNAGGWPAFDETWAAAVPPPGRRFVAMRVERHVVQLEAPVQPP